jgi:broad specificity phosphatase PhoE
MAKWYLVRHGETSWNQIGRLQGHQNTSLNERGRKQSEYLKRRLAGVRFEAAYASDLSRCIETLRIILDGALVPVTCSPLLREQTFGRWEGSSYQQIQTREPDLYDEMMNNYENFLPPGGESFKHVAHRVQCAAEQIRAKHTCGNVLVVGHGVSLIAMIMSLMEMALMSGWRMKLDSCSVTILEVEDKGVVLELFNDTSHLKEAV